FSDLGLSEPMLAALRGVNYVNPTPIQSALIPIAVTGRDCTGQAQTGTGKTAAFVIPILEQIDHSSDDVQALVLCPTRELSEQVADEARRLAAEHDCRPALLVGGRPLGAQLSALRDRATIVVGTPGRVIDHLRRGSLNLDRLKVAVLDEADRMLDIGFRPDIERILRRCPKERQTLLLSATMPPEVERLAARYQRNAERIDLSNNSVACERVEQFYCTVDNDRKFGLLVKLLLRERPQQAIVFRRTKRGADQLYLKLKQKLDGVEAIHGDLQQRLRDKVMQRFRAGRTRLLIATDVVGRGIDVSGISHIINYDVPEYCDDYVHRIGRTGRISSAVPGRAFTFATKEEGEQLTRIEMRINNLLNEYKLDDFQAYTPRAPRKHVNDLIEPERDIQEFHVA
ncbi:MAG: DEAD/DEAH box helicase, partial [Planctomycetaceae bacterium]|nr:DEAD/DEAH box helicase [Planctomycetaceae bacterium]